MPVLVQLGLCSPDQSEPSCLWCRRNPRWLYVLAAATPSEFGDPVIVDETLGTRLPRSPGDVVGIGIHSGNALSGYEVGRLARERGAKVIFGGIHATLYPQEALDLGGAHAVVKGDGDRIWPLVIKACLRGHGTARLRRRSRRRRVAVEGALGSAAAERYMWASVQTVRGCPKHCSFCSVWRTDGQKPRVRSSDAVIEEIVELRRQGFRFIALADDNFYPVAMADLKMADRRADKTTLNNLKAIREERFELMERLARLPRDMVFFTQITMEAAEDPLFLERCARPTSRARLWGSNR